MPHANVSRAFGYGAPFHRPCHWSRSVRRQIPPRAEPAAGALYGRGARCRRRLFLIPLVVPDHPVALWTTVANGVLRLPVPLTGRRCQGRGPSVASGVSEVQLGVQRRLKASQARRCTTPATTGPGTLEAMPGSRRSRGARWFDYRWKPVARGGGASRGCAGSSGASTAGWTAMRVASAARSSCRAAPACRRAACAACSAGPAEVE
jgi:hypothetical protein